MNKILTGLFLLFALISNGQVDQRMKAINNYVNFTNDCIHGMTIAHLMLQGFNNEVNAYVDATTGFQFKNDDFGRDIYSDLSYYEHRGISPSEFYPIVIKEGNVLGAKAKEFNEIITKIFSAAKKLNELRFETGEFIAKNDIRKKSNLDQAYRKLENAAKLFNEIYYLRNQLEEKLSTVSLPNSTDEAHDTYKRVREAYQASTRVLKDIRKRKTTNLKQHLLLQLRSLDPLEAIETDKRRVKVIISNARKAHESASKFIMDGSVPKNQSRYGKFYYYYNSIITSSINTVGSGISFTSNRYFEKQNFPFVNFLDMPPMFKVLYPEKLKASDVIVSSDDNVEELPQILKDRKIQAEDEKIVVKEEILRIQLFDHKLLDGDKVSVNFNGDWIVENQSLEENPLKLKFRLNRNGKNFLLIHSVDEGIVDKVTVGFSYFYNGKKKTQLLSADSDTSKLIEIQLAQ